MSSIERRIQALETWLGREEHPKPQLGFDFVDDAGRHHLETLVNGQVVTYQEFRLRWPGGVWPGRTIGIDPNSL